MNQSVWHSLTRTTHQVYRVALLVPRSTAASFVCSFLVGVTEGLLIASIYLLITPAQALAGMDRHGIWPVLESLGLTRSVEHVRVLLVAACTVLAVSRVLVGYIRHLAGQRVGFLTHVHISEMILNAVIDAGPTAWRRWKKEELLNLIHAEAGKCGTVVQLVMDSIASLISAAVLLWAALWFSWPLTLLACGLGALVLVLNYFQYGQMRAIGKQLFAMQPRFVAVVQDVVNGLTVIKLEGAEAQVKARVHAEVERGHTWRIAITKGLAFSEAVGEMVMYVAMIVLVFFGLTFGWATEGVLLAFIVLAQRLQGNIRIIQSNLLNASHLWPSWTAIHALLDEAGWENVLPRAGSAYAAPAVAPAGSASGEPPATVPATAPRACTGATVELERVAFRYAPELPVVLSDLSLSIRSGERVLIRGPSGSGKSTLIHILCGFLEPTQGEVRVDGQRLDARSFAQLRRKMSHCAPDSFLFRDSLRFNLSMGDGAAGERMIEALERAQAAVLLSELQGGLDGEIGEDGSRLSLGQRQRVMLARMFLKHPALVLLDEATCNLDLAMESQVLRNLADNLPGATIVMVTHRAPAEMTFDRVFEIAGGRLAELSLPTR